MDFDGLIQRMVNDRIFEYLKTHQYVPKGDIEEMVRERMTEITKQDVTEIVEEIMPDLHRMIANEVKKHIGFLIDTLQQIFEQKESEGQ